MPVSREEFARLRGEGYTVEQIVARDRGDTTAAPAPVAEPRQIGVRDVAPWALGGLGLAGLAAAPRVIRSLAQEPGMVGALPRAVRTVFGRPELPIRGAGAQVPEVAQPQTAPPVETQPAQVPEVAQPAAAARGSASVRVLTESDIARYPEFRNASPGDEIRRVTYDQIAYRAPTEAEPGKYVRREHQASLPKRKAPEAGKPREGAQPGARPMKVGPGPVNRFVPSPQAQQGASGPELERRAARQVAATGRPLPTDLPGSEAEIAARQATRAIARGKAAPTPQLQSAIKSAVQRPSLEDLLAASSEAAQTLKAGGFEAGGSRAGSLGGEMGKLAKGVRAGNVRVPSGFKGGAANAAGMLIQLGPALWAAEQARRSGATNEQALLEAIRAVVPQMSDLPPSPAQDMLERYPQLQPPEGS